MDKNLLNEREKLLNEIMELDFALIDLRLFLDTHPNDREAITTFNKLLFDSQKLKAAFEKHYGAMSYTAASDEDEFNWIDNPWPWERTFLSQNKGER